MSAPFKHYAKSLIRGGARVRMQVRKIAEARRALGVLEAARGPLDRRLYGLCDAYARDRLGWSGYAPWLKVYAAVQRAFHDGWLPENYYLAEVLPRVNGEYHRMARRRGANARLFGAEAFPDLAYSVNGIFYDTGYRVIPAAGLAGFLAERADEVVFKSDHSGWGDGIRFLPSAGIEPDRLAALGNGVVQRRLRPHPVFDRFDLPSLATLRIGTVVPADGVPQVRACYLKLGRAGVSHIVARDQLRVAVDWTSGELAGEGYLSDWRPVAKHPDTEVAFGGLSLPRIGDCVATALRLHAGLPLPRYLCWDLVVDDEDRVQVLEWEGGVVSFAEAVQGPCFADLGWGEAGR